MWCEGRLWRLFGCTAVLLGPGSCQGSSGPASPLPRGTEVMGDSKEAGAEAPPAGATARGGLSLLSQGEPEEPSAQVSRLGAGRRAGVAGHSAEEGCRGSRRLPGSPQDECEPECPSSGVQVFTCKSSVSRAALASPSVVTDGCVRHCLGCQGACM